MLYETLLDFIKYNPSGKLMCIDFGQKRIGFAFTDSLRIIASPHSVYHRISKKKDRKYILDLCKSHGAIAIIIGLPLSYDSTEGEACIIVRKFVQELLMCDNCPNIIFQDERLSTRSATTTLQMYNLSRRNQQAVDDKIAASYILSDFLTAISYL